MALRCCSAGLAAYNMLTGTTWPVVGVRLRVDAGLLLVVLVSMVIGLPVTLQYACEQVAQEYWSSHEFVNTNYIITAVWAAAFTMMVGPIY